MKVSGETKKKVLVIEDEMKLQKLVKASLEDAGFEAISAFDGEDGIEKIEEYNRKKSFQASGKTLLGKDAGESTEENGLDEDENSAEESGDNGKIGNFIPIKISDTGLELIELISLDCTDCEGVWHSDTELKIDKKGFVIRDGKKTKEFWDGMISSAKKPLRMKVRNIAGDVTDFIIN